MRGRPPNRSAQGATASTGLDRRPSGGLIIGVRQAAVLVATEGRISADTLDDEDAIRAWLAQPDLHVAAPCRHTPSTQTRRPRGDRSMTAGRRSREGTGA